MKTFLRLLIFIGPLFSQAQITTPVVKANFGVDADLRANYFNGLITGSSDDWFNNGTAGTNTTDSLWMFGGISMDNVTGNRYFDFELYQTDIYYDRVSQKFYGYGPDLGHTSWKFDAAGNVIKPGDIILTGAFQSSTLTNIEARIWVSQADWSTVVPAAFNWSGLFDGGTPGAAYGYASIMPNTS